MAWIDKNLDGLLVGIIGTLVSGFIGWIIAKIFWPKIKDKWTGYTVRKNATGINFKDKFYVWDGPLNKLRDGEFQITPEGLTDALRDIDFVPSYGINEKVRIEHLKMRGTLQVFEMDGATKKELRGYPDQVLFVTPKVKVPQQPKINRRRKIKPGEFRINDLRDIFSRYINQFRKR